MSTRRTFIRTLAAVPPALALGPAWSASDPSRLALVIGNSAYADAPLANPVNDAKAMAGLLTQAGYTVSSHLNATRVEMLGSIERFAAQVQKAETRQVLLYFAGHGAQLEWRNYLLPVDAKADNAAQLRQTCIDLNQLIGDLGKARGKTFIIMLDACRNNPFGSSYQPEQKGLSQFDAPVGSLLAYATSPGNVASDGSGSNGLYTENLLRELSVPGARIEDALKRVRLNVRLASQGTQIPWETTSLEQDVFIFDGGKTRLSEAEQEKLIEQDLAEWGRIKGSDKIDDYAGYLRRFPNGRFAEIVQTRLARLLAAATPSRPTQPAVAPSGAEPTIKLGPNLPVPQFMEPTANPYSAGVYPLGRSYAVGDSATFRETEGYSGAEKRIYTQRVTLVDRASDQVVFDDGDTITDLMGNYLKLGSVTWDTPVQNFPAELQIGKKWTSAFLRRQGGTTSRVYFDYKINRRETITVPAGTFDTFFIEGSGWNVSNGARAKHSFWVIPGLNFPIRREFFVWNRTGSPWVAERHELIALTQGGVDSSCARPATSGVAQRNLVIKSGCGA